MAGSVSEAFEIQLPFAETKKREALRGGSEDRLMSVEHAIGQRRPTFTSFFGKGSTGSTGNLVENMNRESGQDEFQEYRHRKAQESEMKQISYRKDDHGK